MRKSTFFSLFVTIISIFIVIPLQLNGAVSLPKILSSNMVLQRNADVKIWGWADRGERVSVEFNGQLLKTRSDKNGNCSRDLRQKHLLCE